MAVEVDAVTVIQATLAPVFLLSGAGIFITFLQARLFRVMDRLRSYGRALRGLGTTSRNRERLSMHRGFLLDRARFLRNAIAFGVLTLVLTALTTVMLILPVLLGFRLPGVWSVSVFGVGLASFVASLGLGLWDTVVSVRSVELEVAADEDTDS